MIRWTVQEVARRRGIERPQELAEKAGISLNTAKLYWHGFSEAMNLATLDRLCRALRVRPCELISLDVDYTEGNRSAVLMNAA